MISFPNLTAHNYVLAEPLPGETRSIIPRQEGSEEEPRVTTTANMIVQKILEARVATSMIRLPMPDRTNVNVVPYGRGIPRAHALFKMGSVKKRGQVW